MQNGNLVDGFKGVWQAFDGTTAGLPRSALKNFRCDSSWKAGDE
jgi:hypothetical protein